MVAALAAADASAVLATFCRDFAARYGEVRKVAAVTAAEVVACADAGTVFATLGGDLAAGDGDVADFAVTPAADACRAMGSGCLDGAAGDDEVAHGVVEVGADARATVLASAALGHQLAVGGAVARGGSDLERGALVHVDGRHAVVVADLHVLAAGDRVGAV